MSILSRVIKKPGIAMNMILNEFSKDEINNIYPTLGQKIIAALVGELELMGYVDVKDKKVIATVKGKKKLESFKAALTAEEKMP